MKLSKEEDNYYRFEEKIEFNDTTHINKDDFNKEDENNNCRCLCPHFLLKVEIKKFNSIDVHT